MGVFRRGDAVVYKDKNYNDRIQGINNARHVRSDHRAFYFAMWSAPSFPSCSALSSVFLSLGCRSSQYSYPPRPRMMPSGPADGPAVSQEAGVAGGSIFVAARPDGLMSRCSGCESLGQRSRSAIHRNTIQVAHSCELASRASPRTPPPLFSFFSPFLVKHPATLVKTFLRPISEVVNA